jgi:uncharacterized membrane protein
MTALAGIFVLSYFHLLGPLLVLLVLGLGVLVIVMLLAGALNFLTWAREALSCRIQTYVPAWVANELAVWIIVAIPIAAVILEIKYVP